MSNKPIILRNGLLTELPSGEKLDGISSIGFCDISLLFICLQENLLTDGINILSSQNGIPLGFSQGLIPNSCLSEYNNGLINQDQQIIFGTEGEMLI